MVNIRNFTLIIGAITSIFVLSVFGATSSTRLSSSSPTYIGNWSNGRGETLVINATTVKFANDKAVKYRDVTKVTNGREFQLEITSEGKLNYLTKFLSLSMGEGEKPDEMKMTLYDSYKDLVDGANSQGEATWYRDK